MARITRLGSIRAQSGVPTALAGSLVLHLSLALVAYWAANRMIFPPPPQVYRVNLVAAPTPPAAAQPTVTKEAPKVVPKEEPVPKPKLRPKEVPVPAEPVEAKKAAEEPRPRTEEKRTLEKPTADETIRLEGAPFPYPEYLNNLVLQVKRRWRPPSGPQRLTAEISFRIHQDGRVTDIEWVRRSGSFTFDLEARGAVETAARQQAFGPLPQGYPADQLRVVFLFDPAKY